MNSVYVALGSNLENPVFQLQKAITQLQKISKSTLLKISSFYRNPPLGRCDQPDYVNAVVKMKTQLDAHTFLFELQRIEIQQGRVRGEKRWDARIIDLDILLFNNDIIDTEKLTVPHPGIKTRAFVIYPLLEIEKNVILPCGTKLKLIEIKDHDMVPIACPILT